MTDITSLQLTEAGRYGADLIADTTTHTGVWGKVEIIVATAFTTNTAVAGFTADMTGTDFPVGTILRGKFTAIDLSKGTVMAYIAPN